MHWINAKFQWHNSLLAFYTLKGFYMEKNFSNCIFYMLVDFDLCENLFYITTDNILNNKIMNKQLFESIYICTSIQYDEKNQYISCFIYVINFVVSVFSKNMKFIAKNGNDEKDEII